MEDGETPESLYGIAALLINHNLVQIDTFYPHVSLPCIVQCCVLLLLSFVFTISSQLKAASCAWCNSEMPPSKQVNGHSFTICLIVWCCVLRTIHRLLGLCGFNDVLHLSSNGTWHGTVELNWCGVDRKLLHLLYHILHKHRFLLASFSLADYGVAPVE